MSSPPHHLCRQHVNVPLFQGSPEMELLATESHDLLHALNPVLLCSLELTPQLAAHSLLDAMPVLKLRFNTYSRRVLTDADCPGILNAFSVLAQHSQRLNACPELKAAFWLDVLESSMSTQDIHDIPKAMFKNPAFPLFVIDFSIRDSIRLGRVNEALGEALFAFMTSPAALQVAHVQTPRAPQSTAQVPKIAFGLSFKTCELTAISLEIIERFLDRAFAAPTLQYTIKTLDFSKNKMRSEELAVLARIVHKTKRVYQVEELNLDAVLPELIASRYTPQDKTPREFLDIMRTAFDMATLPRLTSREPRLRGPAIPETSTSSHLSAISLRKNQVCPQFFAAHFSALRYGCPLTEGSSSFAVRESQYEDTHVECWRWLAFGLFYPRPKRFASAFKLRTIGKLELSSSAIKTLVRTLRNPAAELVYGGFGTEDGPNVLMVCTVKKGASIEIFEFGQSSEAAWTRAKATWTEILAERSELEALCERVDGSMCVVVPGVGLGWVQREFVECIERESLESCKSEQDGWFDATLGVSRFITDVDDIMALLSTIGRQFRSLAFDFTCSIRGVFGNFRITYPYPVTQTVPLLIGDHCVNLERLTLNDASAAEISGLHDALASGLGRRLLALNLNGRFRGYGYAEVSDIRLATLLARTDDPPALREIRLHGCRITLQGAKIFFDALQVNRTLALIELDYAKNSTQADEKDLKREYDRLDTTYQGQLLHASVPMDIKLAFLSVINWPGGNKATAIASLDSNMLSLVFKFAASCEVRRTIAWIEDITRRQ